MGRPYHCDVSVLSRTMLISQLRNLDNFIYQNGVFVQSNFINDTFEKTYIPLRTKEHRILSDAEVAQLPSVPRSHPLRKEWQLRKASSLKLIKYLTREVWAKNILEVGCGNGWLSNMISHVPLANVIGIDINKTELEQASRVFNHTRNLAFMLGEIEKITFPFPLDYIILASSLQYFAHPRLLISNLLDKLTKKGEIHILDSPIYNLEDLVGAKQRSREYFERQQSGMIAYYHHHAWRDLEDFNFVVVEDPKSLAYKLRSVFSPASPFPWLVIRKNDQ